MDEIMGAMGDAAEFGASIINTVTAMVGQKNEEGRALLVFAGVLMCADKFLVNYSEKCYEELKEEMLRTASDIRTITSKLIIAYSANMEKRS